MLKQCLGSARFLTNYLYRGFTAGAVFLLSADVRSFPHFFHSLPFLD